MAFQPPSRESRNFSLPAFFSSWVFPRARETQSDRTKEAHDMESRYPTLLVDRSLEPDSLDTKDRKDTPDMKKNRNMRETKEKRHTKDTKEKVGASDDSLCRVTVAHSSSSGLDVSPRLPSPEQRRALPPHCHSDVTRALSLDHYCRALAELEAAGAGATTDAAVCSYVLV